MKRLLTSIFFTLFTTAYTAADDHTMIISLSDGSVYAIRNKNIKSIGFSKYDLNEKYYVLKTDTLMVRDTIIDIETIYDTVYIDKPYAVYDTIYVDKEIVKHDTIYVERGHDERTFYTINGKEYPMPKAIDLGLPSGTKWANMNIGATSVYDKGEAFSYSEMSIAMKELSPEWSLPSIDDYLELFSTIEMDGLWGYKEITYNENKDSFDFNGELYLPVTHTEYDEWTWMDMDFSHYCKFIDVFIENGDIYLFGNSHERFGTNIFTYGKSKLEKGYIRLIKKR